MSFEEPKAPIVRIKKKKAKKKTKEKEIVHLPVSCKFLVKSLRDRVVSALDSHHEVTVRTPVQVEFNL